MSRRPQADQAPPSPNRRRKSLIEISPTEPKYGGALGIALRACDRRLIRRWFRYHRDTLEQADVLKVRAIPIL